jgi:exoribonuclease R
MPRGSLVQTLGPVGDLEAEAAALYWLYSPWTGYTKKTSEFKPSEIDVTDRVEIRSDHGWQTFNVDPQGCRDIDDCFSYKWDEYEQSAQCAITIADVAAIIDENSPIDLFARMAGQSLYQDGKKPRHMLPSTVAEDYGALSPNDTRVGITLFFEYDRQTNFIDNIHFKETTITNQKEFTYESIKQTHHVGLLQALCKKLTPTANYEDPHDWIAALMIFYNTEFAWYIRNSAGGLLRAHSGPDIQKQQMLEAIDPELKFLAMSSATYVPATEEKAEHYGLDTSVYTHASSPLRRYADLHNQRIFKEIYHGTEQRPADHQLLETLNQKAKDAKKYERDYGFLQAIFETNSKVISGKVIGLKQKNTIVRIEMWIPAWKRILKISLDGNLVSDKSAEVLSRDEKSAHTIQLAQSLELAFSYDSTKCNWKERMIFRII